MQCVLINPRPTGTGMNEATIEPPVGLGYMAAVLEQRGVSCTIIDAQVLGLDDREIVERIPAGSVLVGISVTSFTVSAAANLVAMLKGLRNVPVVLGGAFPTAAPENALRLIAADGIVRGEGEYAFAQIAENCSRGDLLFAGDVSGACYRDDDGTLISLPVQRITDLDALPFPAYHLMPSLSRYTSRTRKKPAAPLITSRGCSFSCSFCSKDVFKRRTTFRSAANVLREIDHLVSDFGIRQLDILDDNFTQNRQRLEEILDGLIARDYRLAINMQTGIRTELLDEPLLRKMKRAGVFKISFGVESADDEVLRLHCKELDLGRVEETVRSARKLGLVVYGFFIIGLPGETEESFEKTLKFVRKVRFDVANFCIALPFPGTLLYDMIQDRGTFIVDTSGSIDSGYYDGLVFFEFEGNSAADVLRRYQTAYREFYSVTRMLSLFLGIRSVSEFVWLCKAALSVGRGLFTKGR